MSVKQLLVTLKELELVRVRCLSCLAIVQVPLDSLAATFRLNRCLICGRTFTELYGSKEFVPVQLARLAEVIQDLRMVDGQRQVEVSFVLPDKD